MSTLDDLMKNLGLREPATITSDSLQNSITLTAVEKVRPVYRAQIARYTAEDNSRRGDNYVLEPDQLSILGVMARKFEPENLVTGSIVGVLLDRKFPNHLVGIGAAYTASLAAKGVLNRKKPDDYHNEFLNLRREKSLISITVGYISMSNLFIAHYEPIIKNSDAFRFEIRVEEYGYSKSQIVGVDLINNNTPANNQRDQPKKDNGYNFVKDATEEQENEGGILYNGFN